jgi:hypothetical protein
MSSQDETVWMKAIKEFGFGNALIGAYHGIEVEAKYLTRLAVFF